MDPLLGTCYPFYRLHFTREANSVLSFFIGLFLTTASTLAYEIMLTRLLSVISWYYLAFVSVSMAMFGMTAGALAVQLRPSFFTQARIPYRIAQTTLYMGVCLPLVLMTMLAVPVDLSMSLESLYSFLLLSAIISVPFFFAGVAVCLCLTKISLPIGRIYFADLAGAAVGCILSVGLLKTVDAPSAVFLLSAVVFLSAYFMYRFANEPRFARRSVLYAVIMLIIGGLNASTLHGIQPIWSKGSLDKRDNLLAEKWNPISAVRAFRSTIKAPMLWGGSPRSPKVEVEEIYLQIDNDAGTAITRYQDDFSKFDYLRYDVTSLAAQLRRGGTAAIIGVGGGRDVLNCALNGFRRIVGIEINSAVLDMTTKKFASFSGLSRIPGLELHNDEGRSYLTRSGEHFDLIQASLVDTFAATSAGAMTLAENALYTVDGWRVFYEHLKPGGVITFSRWYVGTTKTETYRLFSVAWAMLLSEGVAHPETQLALIHSGPVATLIATNRPFSPADLARLERICSEMEFEVLFRPGVQPQVPELSTIAAARTPAALSKLKYVGEFDYSPVFDSAPYFFNAVRLRSIPRQILSGIPGGNLRAVLVIFAFLLAAVVMVVLTIILPAFFWTKYHTKGVHASGITYFISIGLGFILVEMAMIQQLAIFLGHPTYSFIVVLGGLILFLGLGSLASDNLSLRSAAQTRMPALLAAVTIFAYSIAVIPLTHYFEPDSLWQRIGVSLVLIAPCGFLMGFCFPLGLRSMRALSRDKQLPWMWALNGAAGTLGSFVAVMISMETSIRVCTIAGALCYVIAAASIPVLQTRSRIDLTQEPQTEATVHGVVSGS